MAEPPDPNRGDGSDSRPRRPVADAPDSPLDLPNESGGPLPAVPDQPAKPAPQDGSGAGTKRGDGAVGRGLERLGDKAGAATDKATAAAGQGGKDPLGASAARAGAGGPRKAPAPSAAPEEQPESADAGDEKQAGSSGKDRAKGLAGRLGGGAGDPIEAAADKATDKALGAPEDVTATERGLGGIGKTVGAGIGAAVGGSEGARVGKAAGKFAGRAYGKYLVTVVPALVILLLLMIMALFGATGGSLLPPVGPMEDEFVEEEVSFPYREVYLRVGNDTRVPWPILAAIGEVATDHGCRSPYDNITRGDDCSSDSTGAASPTVSADGLVFPVAEPYQFTDTWGAPRSGGRRHEGTDIMAADGTELYAITGGTIERSDNSLGGLSVYVIADDGTAYYYTHLSAYADEAPVGATVEPGDLIGYVGSTGNASADAPHLHFGIYEGGRGGTAVNPFPILNEITGGANNTYDGAGPGLPDQTLTGPSQGTNWPVVDPAIGGEPDQGVGPFLVPPDVAARYPRIDFQNVEDSVAFAAARLDEIRERLHGGSDPDTGELYDPAEVAYAGFWDPSIDRDSSEGGREEDIQEFWRLVLQEFPIALADIGCVPAAGDATVTQIIDSAFRCEGAERLADNGDDSITILTADGPVTGAAAVDTIVGEARGVAQAWSASGVAECDVADAAAGVFPLPEGSGDRCNPTANIAAAAELVYDGIEASGATSPTAGWDQLPGALGPDDGAGFEFYRAYDPPGDETGDTPTECQEAVWDAAANLEHTPPVSWSAFAAGDERPGLTVEKYDRKWDESPFVTGPVADACGDIPDGYPWQRWARETIEAFAQAAEPNEVTGTARLDLVGLVAYLRTVAPNQLPAVRGFTSLVPRVSNPPVFVEGVPVPPPSSQFAGGGEDPEAFADDVIQTALELVGAVEPGVAGDDVAALIAAGVPPVVAQAYVDARDRLELERPDCAIPVELIAGIGKIESGHGTHGGASAAPNGDIRPLIQGPPTRYGRAEGPMQFLTSTWEGYAAQHELDNNGDGAEDPHNIFDAALGTGHYLCNNAGGSLAQAGSENQRQAVFAYNHAEWYVNDVLGAAAEIRAAMDAYLATAGGGAGPVGAPTGNIEQVNCIAGGVDASIAANVRAMQSAAASAGVTLCGGGWRSTQRQIQLRTINGCPDVWTASPSSCRVPTAIPGTSMHEQGLAIDFENCSSRSTACWGWLNSNASRYGFINLPSEPWHWSTTGR